MIKKINQQSNQSYQSSQSSGSNRTSNPIQNSNGYNPSNPSTEEKENESSYPTNTTQYGSGMDVGKYEQVQKELSAIGINIEDASNAGNATLNMQSLFDQLDPNEKASIAKSFDSIKDLELKGEICEFMKENGIRRYIQFTDPAIAEKLQAAGLKVEALNPDGSVCTDPKASCRDWRISKLQLADPTKPYDKDTNPYTDKVVADSDGKLEQFKWKDFNSDSYIQQAEVNVNVLLDRAGYSCVNELSYMKDGHHKVDELKAIENLDAVGDAINGGAFQGSGAYGHSAENKPKIDGDYNDNGVPNEEEDKKLQDILGNKITNEEFQNLVKAYIEANTVEDKEAPKNPNGEKNVKKPTPAEAEEAVRKTLEDQHVSVG